MSIATTIGNHKVDARPSRPNDHTHLTQAAAAWDAASTILSPVIYLGCPPTGPARHNNVAACSPLWPVATLHPTCMSRMG
jgi:hypothetical protein